MTIRHLRPTLYTAGLLLTLIAPAFPQAQEQSAATPAVRFPRYVVRDLGTLGGKYSFPYNLNDAGVVSGGSATSYPRRRSNPIRCERSANRLSVVSRVHTKFGHARRRKQRRVPQPTCLALR